MEADVSRMSSSLKVLPLRIEQQRSLHWMLSQEAEDKRQRELVENAASTPGGETGLILDAQGGAGC